MPAKAVLLGSNGQIGRVLTRALIDKYGYDNVIGSDVRDPEQEYCRFEKVDITDKARVRKFIGDHDPEVVYHLAALLSAKGETNPSLTWKINLDGLLNVLNVCTDLDVDRVFFPSSIAVFGDTTPKVNTPQASPLLPTTVYGMSKVAGENWCNYYHLKYGLDVRSLRYPGVIGYQSIPEGGTTDYAVEIFHHALKEGHYNCFLEENTRLPMIYMPDAVKATMGLMAADPDDIHIRYSYNLTGMSFTPGDIARVITRFIPDFTIDYKPDFRQEIAASWTESIDDSQARQDWKWDPDYDLESMTKDMLEKIKKIYN
ncbi:MAG: NAD-dependent epimerase/dehydratase family protein [Saprospiraceae bacterium]|nr:NAD-dependent epimerase/dehydratase family protein [Saprospiraceae bacterium]